MRKSKLKVSNISKYLPIFIIFLSLTIIVGSTFAYFTDKQDKISDLTFSKVQLSDETNVGVNGTIRDAIPGSKLIDGAIEFSKSIDSEPIYVRAKVSFSTSSTNEQMQEYVDALRSAEKIGVTTEVQNGAYWSAKDGNYFYLLNKDKSALKVVDDTFTYILTNNMIVPRDLEQLIDLSQYMESVNFYVGFQAIQADNISNDMAEVKKLFNETFPESDAEKYEKVEEDTEEDIVYTYSAVFYDENGEVYKKGGANEGEALPYLSYVPSDPSKVFVDWYTDEALTNKYTYYGQMSSDVALYPKVVTASDPNLFIINDGVISGYTGSETDVVIPSSYSIDGETIIEINETFTSYTKLRTFLRDLPEGKTITIEGYEVDANTSTTILRSFTYPIEYYEKYSQPNYVYGDDYKITTIEDFESTTAVNIVLESGIEIIEYNAFWGCTSLVNIVLPDTLTYIGQTSFINCDNLVLTELPYSIMEIGFNAFEIEHTFPSNGSVRYLPIKGRDEFAIMEVIDDTITDIEWPGKVRVITASTFSGCSNLTSVELHDTLVGIGASAFKNCTSLKEIDLPNSLKRIGMYSFSGCSNIKSLTIPSSIESIPPASFASMRGLTEIKYYVTTMEDISSYNNNGCPFTSAGLDASGITLTIGANVKRLPYGIFAGEESSTPNIIKVVFEGESQLEEIATNAFGYCNKLTSITLPSSLKTIGVNPFRNCPSLQINVDSNNKVYYAENNCLIERDTKSLVCGFNSSIIPSDTLVIKECAFMGCDNLGFTSIPNSVTTLEVAVFQKTNIRSLRMPNSITSIEGSLSNSTLYLLCETTESAKASKRGSTTSTYVLDEITDLSSVTFTSITNGGEVVASGTLDSKTYIKVNNSDGSYSYYVKY